MLMVYLIVGMFVALMAVKAITRPPPATGSKSINYQNQTTLHDKKELSRRLNVKIPEQTKTGPVFERGLLRRIDPLVGTLLDAFQRGVSIAKQFPFLGHRESPTADFTWETYAQVQDRVDNFASGLLALGIRPGQKSMIGVYSKNRPEWVITELSAFRSSMVLVPLYDTLGPDAVRYIINQAEISCVVVDPPKLKLVLKEAAECKTLKHVIAMRKVTSAEKKEFEAAGLQLHAMDEIEQLGKDTPHDPVPPNPEDVAIICYTSGTTGNPKGAILTHGNLVADYSSMQFLMENSNVNPMSTEDAHLSFLPLAHCFELVVQVLIFANGARIGFFSGDIKSLLSDIEKLQPTIFPCVPRLLNRIYDKVMSGVRAKGPLALKLFELGIASKERELQQRIIRRNSIWDTLFFRKVTAKLGGRVRFMITGAAPISPKVLTWFRCVMGCPFVEGYGQTETSAGATVTLLGDATPGIVGPPLVCNEIKLADVPDMNYFATNHEGEVCFRGWNVTQGYWANDEKTKEAIDEDGWLHSGDIGRWTENGALKIIDRKKSMFKLAQGEYIAPEKVENIYVRSDAIQQIFVFGDSLHASVVAIVVPDQEEFPKWIKERVPNIGTSDMKTLCESKEANKAVMDDLNRLAKEHGLHSFECAKAIYLEAEPFSVENGLLTPTFKAKRPQLKDRYKSEIDSMYKDLGDEVVQ